MQIIWNADESVLPWACEIMGTPLEFFDKPRAAGIVDSNGNAIAAVIYSSWFKGEGTMQMSFAAKSPRWCTRQVIKSVLMYPYLVCDVQKLWTLTPHTNERALKLNYGLGFKKEAVLARHLGPRTHGVVCRMFREDYIRLWSKDRIPKHGKEGRRLSSHTRPGSNCERAGCSQ